MRLPNENTPRKLVYAAAKRTIHALCQETGRTVWETKLVEGIFKADTGLVNLIETDDALFAFACGSLFKLDKANGKVLWDSPIKAFKHSNVFLTADGNSNIAQAMAEQQHRSDS